MRTIKSSRFSIHDQCLRLTNHKSTYIKLYTLLKAQRSTLADIYSDIHNKLNEIEQNQSDESELSNNPQNSEKEIEELKNIFLFLNKILKYDLCKLILNSSRIMAKLSKYSIHCAHNETRNMMITSNSSLTLSSNIAKAPNPDVHTNSKMTLSKIRNLVETACVFFVKFQSMMLSSFKYIQENKNVPMGAMQIHNPSSENLNSNNSSKNNYNNRNSTGEIKETLICRLCNEHIDADRFDEHIKSCAIAFKSDLKLKDINAAMANQIDEIKQHFTSSIWPGDLQDATSIVLPVLHVAILLRQAKAVDGSTPEGLEELEDIELSLFQIPIAELEDEKMNIHDDDTNETKNQSRIRKRYQTVALTSTQLFFNRAIYMKSILLIQDKIKVSIALNGASNVLRNTRISGNDRVSEIVKITDFILLKKISAGAFARVFLAQMKKTGDIFAMKVTPKSSLKHKNEVSRIIIEKDIMLNFNNPYIVNFCMYFF